LIKETKYSTTPLENNNWGRKSQKKGVDKTSSESITLYEAVYAHISLTN